MGQSRKCDANIKPLHFHPTLTDQWCPCYVKEPDGRICCQEVLHQRQYFWRICRQRNFQLEKMVLQKMYQKQRRETLENVLISEYRGGVEVDEKFITVNCICTQVVRLKKMQISRTKMKKTNLQIRTKKMKRRTWNNFKL